MNAPQKLGMYKIGSFEVEIYKAVTLGSCKPFYYYDLNGKRTTLNEDQFSYLQPVK